MWPAPSSGSMSPARTSRQPAWCGKPAMPTSSAGPCPARCAPAPWLPRTGQVMLSMYELDGRPAPADPRHALARACAAPRVAGLPRRVRLRGGVLPAAAVLDDGQLRARRIRRRADGRARAASRPTASRASMISRPLFRDVLDAAAAQGLPAGTLMSEYAPGQFEITLQHRDDALRAVDEAVLFKRLLRAWPHARPHRQLHGQALHRSRRLRRAPAPEPRRWRKAAMPSPAKIRRARRCCARPSAA